jgi:hypothetical protein
VLVDSTDATAEAMELTSTSARSASSRSAIPRAEGLSVLVIFARPAGSRGGGVDEQRRRGRFVSTTRSKRACGGRPTDELAEKLPLAAWRLFRGRSRGPSMAGAQLLTLQPHHYSTLGRDDVRAVRIAPTQLVLTDPPEPLVA